MVFQVPLDDLEDHGEDLGLDQAVPEGDQKLAQPVTCGWWGNKAKGKREKGEKIKVGKGSENGNSGRETNKGRRILERRNMIQI